MKASHAVFVLASAALLVLPGCRRSGARTPAEQHRVCETDSDCVLLTGCGWCSIEAVHRDFVDRYERECFAYNGDKCGRRSGHPDTGTDKAICSWQAVCLEDQCEARCPDE